MPPHVRIDFVVPPPGWGRSVTDFWGWGARRAQLCCSDYVSDDVYERGVPGRALNLNSTGYPDHGRNGALHLQGKIPTQDLTASSQRFWPPSHEAGLIDGCISMVNWWNDTDRGNPKHVEKILSQCHFVIHQSYTERRDIEPGSLRWEAHD
jgi:hypothetical protein